MAATRQLSNSLRQSPLTGFDLRTVNDLPRGAARWVTDVIGRGSRIAWARRLRLGGWHVNHALDVVDADGRTHRLVLRRWARPDWAAENPDYTVERAGDLGAHTQTWVFSNLGSSDTRYSAGRSKFRRCPRGDLNPHAR